MTHITFKIPDMHCSNCVMRLEGIEDNLPGIARIRGSYIHQTLDVNYDELQVSQQQLVEAIQKLGYSVAV